MRSDWHSFWNNNRMLSFRVSWMAAISLPAPLPILSGRGEHGVRNRQTLPFLFLISLFEKANRASSFKTADSHFASDSFFFFFPFSHSYSCQFLSLKLKESAWFFFSPKMLKRFMGLIASRLEVIVMFVSSPYWDRPQLGYQDGFYSFRSSVDPSKRKQKFALIR